VLLYAILESVQLTRILISAWVLYRFAIYVWRSTTLGGIVLNLQVQKLDDTTLPGDHSTALIARSLVSSLCCRLAWVSSGFFSTRSEVPGTTKSAGPGSFRFVKHRSGA